MTTNGFLILTAWMAFGVLAVRADDLTCSISVLSFKPKDEALPAELVIKNGGPKAIRICTMCMRWGSGSQGSFTVQLDPVTWKSDAPTLETIAKSIVTIEPGGVARIPFEIHTHKSQQMHVTASYSVRKGFLKALHVWSGYIEAKPVDIKLEQ